MTRRAPRCLVKGSVNVDEVYALPHIVRPGETISSASYSRKAGGKGANQAYALAKAGAAVDLDSNLGQDGLWIAGELRAAGVGTETVSVHPGEATGRAIIQVSADGENAIVLHKGANFAAEPNNRPSVRWSEYTHLVVQNEIPWTTSIEYLTEARAHGLVNIFNPSPMPSAAELKAFPWQAVDWLLVNAGELEDLLALLGIASSRAGSAFQEQTLSNCAALRDSLDLPKLSIVCTLGPAGAIYVDARAETPRSGWVPCAELERPLRNTTGAGDCLTGYFVAGLMGVFGEVDIAAILGTCVVACAVCVEEDEAMKSIPPIATVLARRTASARAELHIDLS